MYKYEQVVLVVKFNEHYAVSVLYAVQQGKYIYGSIRTGKGSEARE